MACHNDYSHVLCNSVRTKMAAMQTRGRFSLHVQGLASYFSRCLPSFKPFLFSKVMCIAWCVFSLFCLGGVGFLEGQNVEGG